MIKHIVFWKMKPEVTMEQKLEIKRRLEALKDVIPEILEIEVGLDYMRKETSSDIALYSVFKSDSDLSAYQVNPEHVKFGEFLKPLVAERRAVDYEF